MRPFLLVAGAIALAMGCDGGCGDGSGGGTGGGGTVTGTGGGPASSCVGLPVPGQDHVLAVDVGGVQREAVIHLPPGYDATQPLPVVVGFHFFSGTPSLLMALTDLDEAAEAAGTILALPAGVDGSFNAGKCCGSAWANDVDDVAFTAALLDAIEAQYCVRADRVLVTGMSNGALMAHRVGCELADRISGIAPVAGPLHIEGSCSPSEPIHVLQFHGTGDTQMPYNGGVGVPPVPVPGDLTFMSIPDSMEIWRTALGCSGATVDTYVNSDVICERWTGCSGGAHVELCTVDDGGHTWPGGSFPVVFGKTSTDLAAGQYMTDFLSSL